MTAGFDMQPQKEAQRIVRVIIAGDVQGVGYRAWTQKRAETLGIEGWVRNRSSGDVEAVFSGPAAAVEALCDACWRGPALARVVRVEVAEVDADFLIAFGEGGAFRQIATV